MIASERKRTCFVVMPFGEKSDLDGQEIDFDDIYRFFLKKAIEDLGIECIRCDEIEESGSIHGKMFEHIYQSDVVVVDITTSNANVYYELGIRHTLAKGVTVLIRRRGTTIPFNIQGLQVVEYDQAKFGSIERAKARIHSIIKNGLNLKLNDSPVHSVLDLNIEPEGKPLGETRFVEYRLKGAEDRVVGLVTGDIQNVTRGVDVWVNSENTDMQMARPYENSISGVIRYHGGRRVDGRLEDSIALALTQAMGGRASVAPAEVLVTTSGSLERSHGVRRIFHVAAVSGQVGQGYTPIADVTRCVVNALNAPTDPANAPACAGAGLSSILFPLMGSRPKQGRVQELQVRQLLETAIEYLAVNPDSTFRKVYFLAYTDKELEVCQDILNGDPGLTPPKVGPPSEARMASEPEVTRSPASAPAPGGNGAVRQPGDDATAAEAPARPRRGARRASDRSKG